MTLKSTDEEYSKEVELVHKEGLSYHYEVEIDDINLSKEYYMEAILTNAENMGTEKQKTQIANLNAESEVGIFKDTTRLILKDNMMIFEPIETVMLMEEPKVEEQEDSKEENKVEEKQIEITNKQEEVNKESEEKIPEVVEEKENDKQEGNEIEEENAIEETNVVENTIDIIELQNTIKEDAN